jgi:AmmeMemoRadiSam system protein A
MKNELKIYLLLTARKAIAENLGIKWDGYKEGYEIIKVTQPPKSQLNEVKGTFVTLTIDGMLRGCIGQITPTEPISTTVRDNAISAAMHDPRFSMLSAEEFYRAQVEISILSKPVQLKYTDHKELFSKIEQGKHGIIIRMEGHSATFLPQVWDDIQTKQEFFTQLCLKARIFPDEWRSGKLEVYTYTVEHFNEKELRLEI